MKKFFAALILIFLISSVSFGAETNNKDDYVRRDVFDARMDRMEALLQKTVMEIKAENEKFKSEILTEIQGMKTDNEKFRSEIRTDIQGMKNENEKFKSEIRADIQEIKAENEKFKSEIRADIQEIKAENEKFKNEVRSDIDELRGDIKELKADNRRLETKIDGIDKRLSSKIDEIDKRLTSKIDDLSNVIYWIFAVVGIIFTAAALTPIVKNLTQPKFTLEDVERLIDSKLSMKTVNPPSVV